MKRWLACAAVAAVTMGGALSPAAMAFANEPQAAISAAAISEQGIVSKAGTTVGHLKSGSGNGNNHFGGQTPEAFVLSNEQVGDKPVGVDMILQSDAKTSRARFVLKYVNDNTWAYLGYGANDGWFIEFKDGNTSAYPKVEKLPNVGANERAHIQVSHEGNTISVTVNGVTSKITNEHIAKIMKQQGKVGMGAATFGSEITDLLFTNVRMGDKNVTDFSKWTTYRDNVEGQTWVAAENYDPGRKWIEIVGGSNNGGGHSYGNAGAKAPALLLDNSRTTKNTDVVDLSFTPTTDDMNFGFFLSYTDDNNFCYVGYDGSSKWYLQYKIDGKKESWPGFGGNLATPVKGQEMHVKVSVEREKVTLTVNDTEQSLSNKDAGDFLLKNSGKGKFGVKVNNQSGLKFADAKLGDQNIMEDQWGWAAQREGQKMAVSYVNLANITGSVKAKDGSKPLEGATVRVGNKVAKTDASGNFSFTDVEVGKKTLSALAPGYQPKSMEIDVQNKANQDKNVANFVLEPKAEADLTGCKKIESDQMSVLVSPTFPQPMRYELKGGAANGKIFRGEETRVSTFKLNGKEVTPEVSAPTVKGDTATYVLQVRPKDGVTDVNATFTVELKVEGTTLTWRIAKIDKAKGSGVIKTIDMSGMNLLMLDAVDGGQGFAGAQMSTNVNETGDRFYSFDGTFKPNTAEGFMYGFLSNNDLSAGVFTNSEAEKDRRVTLNSGLDTMGLASSVFYYEHGDKEAQNYISSHNDVKSYPTSELPWAKVAISEGDMNADKTVDWNDGAIALRPSLHVPYGSEDVKDLVGTRIVMNFGSEVTNPYMQTADNIKKFSLATDGLPQAVVLKGYGNEGHDSANSEYADISSKEGGAKDFRELIKIAHQYDTQVGIHINAQEAYAESKSFNERMIKDQGNGWGWMDQSVVIDKLWDLGSGARWNRMVQLYDRINGTNFANKNFEKGEYVGDPAQTGAKAASMDELRKDAAGRKNNMDFIYLDVWYEDAWETRRIAEQINSLGWRFSTEFPQEGEYDSTWSHWATEVHYGGSTTKGINSDIARFLRNDQRDTSPNNGPGTGGVMNNPLLGGWQEEGFEGWGNEQDFNAYLNMTFTENLPTRFLQHYQVVDWDNYGEGEKSPVANHEKQIRLTNKAGDQVVVTRKEAQRKDDVCERVITLNGKKVLEDGAYLLPWEQDGEHKLYHYNVDGGSTTWDLPAGFQSGAALYKLTDQGRVKVTDVSGASVTIDAEAKTPYVIAKADSKAKTASDVKFGEGTGVVDPGFNAYAEGEKLDKDVWGGTIANDAVAVKHNKFGDQQLTITDPAEDVAVSTKLTGLKKGKTYVAEVYVANESDATATVAVKSGKEKVSRTLERSVVQNYTASDQRQNSYMTRVYVKFTAQGDTATIRLSRKAGKGVTTFDNIRVVEASEFPVQAADGSFVQDFEHAVSGLYPFVIGPSSKGGDAVAHLSERNGKFTQTGFHDKQVDDALDGNWSLKYHDGRKGLLYQTTPQTLKFEPGKRYTVEFDYQAGSVADKYQIVVGDGEGKFTEPKQFLPVTFKDGKQKTSHIKMEVTGAQDGQTWIGLYSGGNSGNTGIGSGDFVLDNLKVTCLDKIEPAEVAWPYYVNFFNADGSFLNMVKLDDAGRIPQPETPVRPGTRSVDELEFVGWYNKGEKFDFNKAVEDDINLVATWGTDMSEIGPSAPVDPEQQPETPQNPGTPDEKPGADSDKPGSDKPGSDKPGSSNQSGHLVQTGDNALLPIVGAATAGIVLAGAGIAITRKGREQ